MSYVSHNSTGGQPETPWWKLPKTRVGGALHNIVDTVSYYETHNHDRFRENLRIWSTDAGAGLSPYLETDWESHTLAARDFNIRYLVCRSQVETATAKIAKQNPLPKLITDGANRPKQRKVKLLEQYIHGVIKSNDGFGIQKEVFRDAAIFGRGHIIVSHAVDRKGRAKVVLERVYPWEIYVDPIAGYYGKPRDMFRRRLIDRGVLKALFPAQGRHIDELPCDRRVTPNDHSESIINGLGADTVAIVEAWHLPSSDGANDGYYAIGARDLTLGDVLPWTSPRLPVVTYFWSRLHSFSGEALVDEAKEQQYEINELGSKMKAYHYQVGKPLVFYDATTNPEMNQLNNSLDVPLMPVQGPPGQSIEIVNPPAMHPQFVQYFELVYDKSWEISGVSQMSGASVKPAGVTAAVAMQELNDIESQRFVIKAQEYEQVMSVQLARVIVDESKRASEKYEVGIMSVSSGKRGTSANYIDWSEVDMDSDDYQITVSPASSLPTDPAGKLTRVMELVNAGWLDKETAMMLIDMPDIREATSVATAEIDAVMADIDEILEEGNPVIPEPFSSTPRALQLAVAYRNKSRANGEEPRKLLLLSNYIAALHRNIMAATPPAAPQPPMPQGQVVGANDPTAIDPNATGPAIDPATGAPIPVPGQAF